MTERAELTPLDEVPPINPEVDKALLPQLTDVAIPLINRHINPARFRDPALRDEFPTVTTYMGDNSDQWTPALMVPWTVGQNFAPNYDWHKDQDKATLPQAAVSALLLGLLTEDNLPWYSETINRKFGGNEALNFWNRIWTGEEDRHSEVMRAYMTTGRLVDPVQLDRDRMAQIITAEVPEPPSATEAFVYVTIQELATRISHMNTGKLIADTVEQDEAIVRLSKDGTALASVEPVKADSLDPEHRESYVRQVARTIMTRIAGDENKHFAFYRDLTEAATQIDPSTVVKALEKQIRGFQMPGTGIRDFWTHAGIVAEAGVYDLEIHHDKILSPVLKRLGFVSLEGLDDEAERARERTLAFMGGLKKTAARYAEQRDERRAAAADDPSIIWVGKPALAV